MKLLAVTPLGRNRDKSRLWIESRRLEALGFPPGTPITIEARGEKLLLRPSVLAENHVSSRRIAGGVRPIIDVANRAYLSRLADYPELKITETVRRTRHALVHLVDEVVASVHVPFVEEHAQFARVGRAIERFGFDLSRERVNPIVVSLVVAENNVFEFVR